MGTIERTSRDSLNETVMLEVCVTIVQNDGANVFGNFAENTLCNNKSSSDKWQRADF